MRRSKDWRPRAASVQVVLLSAACSACGSPESAAPPGGELRAGGLCGQDLATPPSGTCGNSTRNEGELCWVSAASLSAPDTSPRAHLLVGNLGGSNDIDILVEDAVLLGTGGGSFASAIPIPPGAGPVTLYAEGAQSSKFSAGFVGVVRTRRTQAQPDVRNILYEYDVVAGPSITRTAVGEIGRHELLRSITVHDFDADELVEFAIEKTPEHDSNTYAEIIELDDQGNLMTATPTPLGRSDPRMFGHGILEIDADDDGDMDLLMKSALYENNGSNDWDRHELPRNTDGLATFFATHFDCAGVPDVVARLVGTPFKIYENRGMSSSSYGFGPTGGANEYEYTVLAAGLLNEDFALDVLMVGDGGTYVLLGNGAVPPTLAPIQLTTTKWAAAVVMDIDADTDTEIVATTGAGDVDIWEENL